MKSLILSLEEVPAIRKSLTSLMEEVPVVSKSVILLREEVPAVRKSSTPFLEEELSAIVTISAFGLPLSFPAFPGRHSQSPRRRSALNLVPRMWFFRFQNPFHAVIIPPLDTALQPHRSTDMALKRGHSFAAAQKSRHGFRDERTVDFNKNCWGRLTAVFGIE